MFSLSVVIAALLCIACLAGCPAARERPAAGAAVPEEALGMEPCRELASSSSPAQRSLVLVVNDAMRRDRTGAYGGSARTAHFDAFARDHLLFRRAVSQSPWTKPSIATLFTARLPSQHGVLDDERLPEQVGAERVRTATALAAELPTLAEVLRDSGFRTAAFVANPWLEASFGWDQGFEVYDDSFAAWGARGDAVSQAATDWLGAVPEGQRFFLYLHYIDGHFPYGAPTHEEVIQAGEKASSDARALLAHEVPRYLVNIELDDGRPLGLVGVQPTPAVVDVAYDRGLENFDRSLGTVLEALAARNDWKETAVVVTSDHGEALWERGYGDHGHVLFESLVGVPLAARLPGVLPSRGEVDCPVGLVDVLPTICDYFGLPCPEPVAGVSWLSPKGAAAAGDRRYVVSEGVMQQPRHRAVQNQRYKLLFEPGGRIDVRGRRDAAAAAARPYALYDLERDPAEQHDLLAEDTVAAEADAVAAAMIEALSSVAAPLPVPETPSLPVDPALQRRLEALGYTQ